MIPRDERGVGLIELIVALVLTSMVLIAVFGTFFRTQTTATTVANVVDRRQNARAAVQLIERDLRMAGSGWGRDPVYGYFAGADTFQSIEFGYGGPNASDSVAILGGWDQMTTLSAAMASPATLIQVVSSAGFQANDFVVVTDGKSAHLFQATAVTTSPNQIEHATTSAYNTTGALSAWPASGYGQGAQVYRAGWISYRVDTTQYERPALVRREANRPEQLVAYDVAQFTVNYLLQDGSITRDPASLATIDKLVPVVRTVASSPGNAVADSAWASVRPRTF